MSTVHVLFNNQSRDFSFDELFPEHTEAIAAQVEQGTVGLVAVSSRLATSVKEAVASYYDRPLTEFSNYVVQIEENGNITVHPKATLG